MFVKSTRFKQVSTTFVPDCLKYVSVFSGQIFDAAEFLCDDVTLWAKLAVYKRQFVKFRPDLQYTQSKMFEEYVIT